MSMTTTTFDPDDNHGWDPNTGEWLHTLWPPAPPTEDPDPECREHLECLRGG